MERDSGDEEDDDFLSEENLKKLFIDVKDLIVALQDEGKAGKPKDGAPPTYRWPKLTPIATKYYELFKKKKTKIIPLTANASRDKQAILSCIIRSQKHMDMVNVLPSLMQHVRNKNVEKVFIINNDVTGGQRLLITNCYSFFSSRVVKQQGMRNGSIAIRVAYCLCHPSLRAAAMYWLANKKTRDDLDQPTGDLNELSEKP